MLQVDSVNVLSAPLCRSLPDGALRTSSCCCAEPRRSPRRVVEVLGACAGVHARGAVAGDAAPDGVIPRKRGSELMADDHEGSSATCWPRSATAAPRRRDLDDGCRAKDNWGWNWSEPARLLDHLLPDRRGRDAGRSSQFEIPTTCRAGPPRRRARPPADIADANRSWSGARLRSTASRPSRTSATTTGCRSPTPRPPSPSWSRTASYVPVTVAGWRHRPTSTDARLPRASQRGPAQPVRPGGGGGPAPGRCSTSTTGSRSTSPAEKGPRLATCCRSCSATGSSRGSTQTADRQFRPRRRGRLVVRSRTPSPRPPRPPTISAELPARRLARLATIHGRTAQGDLAPLLVHEQGLGVGPSLTARRSPDHRPSVPPPHGAVPGARATRASLISSTGCAGPIIVGPAPPRRPAHGGWSVLPSIGTTSSGTSCARPVIVEP